MVNLTELLGGGPLGVSVGDFLIAVIQCDDPPTVGGTIPWLGAWTVCVEKGQQQQHPSAS